MLRARVGERADLGRARVVEAARAPRAPRCGRAPPASTRPARPCRRRARPPRARRAAPARPPPREVQRVARRAQQRGRAVLAHRLQALHGVHAAERDHERAGRLRALVGGPELHVGAERVRERDAVARADARRPSARARAARATTPSPRRCRARAASCRCCRSSGAGACSARAGTSGSCRTAGARPGRRAARPWSSAAGPPARAPSPIRARWNALPSSTVASSAGEPPLVHQTRKNAVSPRALEVEVDRVAAVRRRGDHGRALRVVEQREHRVGGVGLRLVAEVDPRDDAVQQPAGEQRDGEVRRLRPAAGGRARGRA